MEKILREILAEDKSILSRRDDLIALLDKKVPGNLSRDCAPIKKAVNLNIGEIFFVNDREVAAEKATEILKSSGMQEGRIKFVVETFSNALEFAEREEKRIQEEKERLEREQEEERVRKEQERVELEKELAEIEKKFKEDREAAEREAREHPVIPAHEPVQTPLPPPKSAVQNDNTKKIFIALGCVLLLFLFVGYGNNFGKNTPNVTRKEQTQTTNEKTTGETKSQPTKSSDDDRYLRAKSDLSLDGMDLGIPMSEVKNYLGNEDRTKPEGNFLRFFYGDLQVVSSNGKLVAIVSNDSKYKTKRGLHVGSTYQEVVEKYGTNYKRAEYEGLILYEYPFNTIDNQYGLLRFAVNPKNNLVDYISIRVVEDKPAQSQQQNQNGVDENARQAATAFLNFHKAITGRNYNAAFNLYTEARKKNMNYNIQAFANGYTDTLSSEITKLTIVSSSPNRVVMDYILDARDRTNGPGTLYQQFKGQVEMVKENGEWKIDSARSDRIKEIMER